MRMTTAHKCILLSLSSLLVLFFLFLYSVEGLVLPIRVVGGSMAETFYGPHYSICCPDCRFRFPVDATSLPPTQTIRCPNCGYQNAAQEDRPVFAGERLLVDRLTYQLREPARWEPILFRSSQPPLEYCLKRVVGLPNESVKIAAGDVWINDRRLKKDWPTSRAMAIMVHDSRFRSTAPDTPLRWRPWTGANGWERIADGFHFDAENKDDPAHQNDWLVYHHLDFLRGAPRISGRITDDYAYNQTISRSLYPTDDLVLSAQVQARGSGRLKFRVGACDLQLDTASGRGMLLDAGHLWAEFSWDPSRLRQLTQIEVAVVDRQFFFVLAGEVLVSCDLEDASKANGNSERIAAVAPQPSKRQFFLGIGAENIDLHITDLQVLRDVYYTKDIVGFPHSRSGVCQVGEDEFFVLGDNSPISLDSRRDAESALVDRDNLRGRVWRWR